jgi:uncharacterized repeat protein (TIGR03943 family)
MSAAEQTAAVRPIVVRRLSGIVAASPPLLAALLIAKLWLSGTLLYYVNSRTLWIVLTGGALFAVVGAVALRQAMREEHAPAVTWRTIVFLIPLLIGLFLPAQPLSALSGQSSSFGSLQMASHVSGGSPGDTFPVWVGDLGTHADPSWWAGRKATLVGFVTQEPGLPRGGFIVGRYLVTCCVVDATLMGFPAVVAHGHVPGNGAWVQVTGVFGHDYWTDPTGQHYPILTQARIVPVSIPSSPYLSP